MGPAGAAALCTCPATTAVKRAAEEPQMSERT